MNENAKRRRLLIHAGLGLGLASRLGLTAADAPQIPVLAKAKFAPKSAAENLAAYVKLIGSTAQETVYISFNGTLWGLLPGQAAKPVCGFFGLARSQWQPRSDGSFHRKSFDIGYFSDLETGEPLKEFVNPLTGEMVEPFHYKYGGSETKFTETGTQNVKPDGSFGELKPHDINWRSTGDQVWLSEISGGEVASPLQPDKWPRESPGEMFHYASETSYTSSAKQLSDDRLDRADYSLFWTSMVPWEPWMLMDGTAGQVMWRAVGVKLNSYQQAPAQLLEYIAKEQANYFANQDPWQGVLGSISSFAKQRKPAPKARQ